jgi:hypothetical protein
VKVIEHWEKHRLPAGKGMTPRGRYCVKEPLSLRCAKNLAKFLLTSIDDRKETTISKEEEYIASIVGQVIQNYIQYKQTKLNEQLQY